MIQTDPTTSRPTAADILRRAEHLLARPSGWLATRLVGFELTHPPATHIPPHGWSDLVATWEGDLPTVSEITAVGADGQAVRHTQARRAQARKSHTKATRRTLRAAGVRLTTLIRCRWPSDRAL